MPKARSTRISTFSSVVSSSEIPTRSVPILRKFSPSCRAAARMPACPTPTSTVIVSKNALGLTFAPAAFSARARRLVRKCTRSAIARRPFGPWNTA